MSSLPSTNPKKLSILLVEDDDCDAKAIARSFDKSGLANYVMMRAVDGVEALEMLKGENGKPKPLSPCILLVDLNMPRMNGIQFVKALRADKALRRSVVFILTTSKRSEDTIAAYDLNVAGYITKGTAAEDHLKLVTLIDLYAGLVELPE